MLRDLQGSLSVLLLVPRHTSLGFLRCHLAVEMASSDASVCVPQTSSRIVVLAARAGLRGALKGAHLPCPGSDLRPPVPRRGAACCSSKQRVKDQPLCLAPK